jgi:hypothetical protein
MRKKKTTLVTRVATATLVVFPFWERLADECGGGGNPRRFHPWSPSSLTTRRRRTGLTG